MRLFATLVGCVMVVACDPTVDLDGGPIPDGGPLPDAPTTADGGVDSALDAPMTDAPADGFVPPDAPACDCPTPAPCFTSRCEGGVCFEDPLPDGAACGEDMSQHCVAAECVTRGCGDGYRERTGALREGCDDGNLVDGDGCSAECAPTVVFHEWETDELRIADAPAVAWGDEVLIAWVEQEGATAMRTMRARVGTREYVLDGPRPWIAKPVAVADPSGFVVAYETLAGIGLHRITSSGDLRSVAPTGDEADRHPVLAATDDGFVVAWRRDDRIWIREHRGGFRSDPQAVATGASGELTLAALGAEGVVAWESGGGVFARAFSGASPTAEAYLVADAAISPHSTRVGAAFEFSWTSFMDDFFGDVLVGPEAASALAVATSEGRERSRGIEAYGPSWVELHEIGPLAQPTLAFGPDAFVVPELVTLSDALRFADPQTSAIAAAPGGVVVTWVGFTGGGPDRQLACFFLPDS